MYKDAPHAELPYHVKELNTVDGYVRDFGTLESPAVQATWLVRARAGPTVFPAFRNVCGAF